MHFDLMLQKLILQTNLTSKEAEAVFSRLFKQELTPEQIKTILVLLAKKGESNTELEGCLNALRKLEKPKDLKLNHLIDTCGTGGDASSSINVSTMSALVAAAAGAKVAKHGNRAITSKSGSSDLISAFGINLDISPSHMQKCLKKTGFGYFHAPLYHPVFAKMQPIRKEIKVRTIFNLMGPLINPFFLTGQVLGVSNKDHLELFASVLKKRKMKSVMLCHSRDGLDEISTSSLTDVIFIKGSKITRKTIDPKQFGFKKAKIADYRGGDVKENHKIAKLFFEGKLKGPKRDIALMNSAAAIYVAGLRPSLEKSLELAIDTVEKGVAMEKIKEVASFTQRKGL